MTRYQIQYKFHHAPPNPSRAWCRSGFPRRTGTNAASHTSHVLGAGNWCPVQVLTLSLWCPHSGQIRRTGLLSANPPRPIHAGRTAPTPDIVQLPSPGSLLPCTLAGTVRSSGTLARK